MRTSVVCMQFIVFYYLGRKSRINLPELTTMVRNCHCVVIIIHIDDVFDLLIHLQYRSLLIKHTCTNTCKQGASKHGQCCIEIARVPEVKG